MKSLILELLDREGLSLIALNAALYAADKSDRVAALRVQLRNHRAQQVIWSYATLKVIGVGLNPVPVADVIGGTAILSGLQRARVRLGDGTMVEGVTGFVDVFENRSGTWRLRHAVSVELPSLITSIIQETLSLFRITCSSGVFTTEMCGAITTGFSPSAPHALSEPLLLLSPS